MDNIFIRLKKAFIPSKKVYVVRSVPGAGKTTLIRQYVPDEHIFSADKFFMKSGTYQFDPNKLGQAHRECLTGFVYALRKGVKVVGVDNTNTRYSEMEPYLFEALKYGYEITILYPQTPWAWNAEECFNRNTHGVPLESIKKMIARFEVLTPDKIQELLGARMEIKITKGE